MRSALLRHELRLGLSGDRLLVRRCARRCVPSRLSGSVLCVPVCFGTSLSQKTLGNTIFWMNMMIGPLATGCCDLLATAVPASLSTSHGGAQAYPV